ncbi:MAG: hypothetical protein OXF79_17430 [Chloroflexi bacterium]|nr:hypothetical protein [Chloroflexota bacterium]
MNKSVGSTSAAQGDPGFILEGIGPLSRGKGGRPLLKRREGKFLEIQLVEIPKDGKQGGKRKLVRLCNDALYQAYKLDLPIAGVPGVMGAMVEGKGLYWDSIGEFFQLYGQLEQKLGLADGYKQEKIADDMRAKLEEDAGQHSRKYTRDGVTTLTPLPLYVRNVLVHGGTNPANGLADGDVKTSIQLLKDWLGR